MVLLHLQLAHSSDVAMLALVAMQTRRDDNFRGRCIASDIHEWRRTIDRGLIDGWLCVRRCVRIGPAFVSKSHNGTCHHSVLRCVVHWAGIGVLGSMGIGMAATTVRRRGGGEQLMRCDARH